MTFLGKSFKIKFEISKGAFVDYEHFAGTFAHNAQLCVENTDKSQLNFTLENQWKTSLNRNGDIDLCSPVLGKGRVGEVSHLLEVLKSMNVKIGENCQAQIQYVRFHNFGFLKEALKKIRVEFLCGLTLIAFLLTKTVEIHLARAQEGQGAVLFQLLGYCFLMLFTLLLYKSILRKPVLDESVLTFSNDQKDYDCEKVAGAIQPFPLESLASPLPSLVEAQALEAAELIREIKYPVENIMAYTRFYQTTTDKESQHWKDVVEIMEQAIRIQEVINRVESTTNTEKLETLDSAESQGRNLFRRTPRTMELLPLVVRGSDPLGELFETPSYTLNTSRRGACLLLPGKVISVGQEIYMQNHQIATEASVRWVLPGKEGGMVFAGVEFARPVLQATECNSANNSAPGLGSFAEGGYSNHPHSSE
jgi:hypothetical protein